MFDSSFGKITFKQFNTGDIDNYCMPSPKSRHVRYVARAQYDCTVTLLQRQKLAREVVSKLTAFKRYITK